MQSALAQHLSVFAIGPRHAVEQVWLRRCPRAGLGNRCQLFGRRLRERRDRPGASFQARPSVPFTVGKYTCERKTPGQVSWQVISCIVRCLRPFPRCCHLDVTWQALEAFWMVGTWQGLWLLWEQGRSATIVDG